MADQSDNFLFYGDQTEEKLPVFKTLSQNAGKSQPLRQFLRDACDVVQQELFMLRPDERASIKDFDSLLDLAEGNARAEKYSEIVATILMNVARLGEMIHYADERPEVLGSPEHPIHVLGFCTGEIPAAVAVAARNTSELYKVSMEAVHVICRFAREVIRRSVLIDRTVGNWATTLVGVTQEQVQKILDEFHQSQGIPSVRHVAIGFVSRGWVTLFGPPTTVERLFETTELGDTPKTKTDAGGGVHMPNLPELDLETIVGNSPLLSTPITSKAKILSPYDCEFRSAATLGELFKEIIHDVAQRMLRLSDTLEVAMKNFGARPVQLTVVGLTGHLPFLEKAFQSKGIEMTVSRHGVDPNSTSGRGGSNDIAIVGMAGRFPGSETIEEYWQLLLDGERLIREIPKERFDLEKWYDAAGKQKNSIVNRTGAFLDKPGYFDNRLFNMSPREALQTDALHRLFLTTSYEALEMAGYSPDGSLATGSNRIATYFGQTSDDWRDIVLTQGVDIYYATGICRAFAPGRLNYHYKWGGASYSVDAACASSVTTISLAVSALIARECDMAVAGGGSILDSPAPFSGLSRGGFLSTHAGCETYHDDADGYVRGEGMGVVILKRLEDALADNDNILAVVKGAARNYSKDSSSITHPSAEAQHRLYRQVLHQTSTDANSIAYVEMHGTGTQAGDSMEMSSVLKTFALERTKDNPLVVGAVKANIGHGEAAAGVCALIKVLKMMQERKIPPQPGMPFKINHHFPDLNKMNVYLAGQSQEDLQPSSLADGKLRVFLNSFDASGGNSCLLLEEAPEKPEKEEDPRTHHVVTFSARTAISLRGIKERYLAYLQENPETPLADLAYSTTARRMHGQLRSSFTAATTENFISDLEADLKQDGATPPSKNKDGDLDIVFTFTGQGSQYAGMGQQLWQGSRTFREILEALQTMATAQDLPNFTELIENDELDLAEESPVRVQLAIVALEVALAELWQSWGVKPAMVMGHSLGEYAALCIAGVLTVSDTLYLVGRRAKMLEENLTKNEYAMLACGKELDDTSSMLSGGDYPSCEIACLNAPKSTVVSGTIADLERLQQKVKDEGSRSSLLRVPYGFHSKQLEPILEQYETCAEGALFSAPKIPVASTLLGDVIGDDEIFSANYLRRQAREPVNFAGALQAAQDAGIVKDTTSFVEMGPDAVCLGLLRMSLGGSAGSRLLASLRNGEDNWRSISNSLGTLYESGRNINWPEFHKEYVECLSLLDLPTYAFDEKNFWTPYPDPGTLEEVETKSTSKESAPVSSSVLVPSVEGYPTTTLQRLTEESIGEGHILATFESSTSDPHLFAAIQGHAVADVKICSSSIFSDMALSAARYGRARLQPNDTTPLMSIRKMDINRAIVVMDKEPVQTIMVTVEHTANTECANVLFRLFDGKSTHELGGCEVLYGDSSAAKQDLSRTLFLLSSRIDSLRNSSISGKGHRLLRPVIYRLFSNLVEYGERFQGLDDIILGENLDDAVGHVKLPVQSEPAGNFLYSPYLLDSIVHIAGFLVNCGLKYSQDVAFLSTGFAVWRLLKPLSHSTTYTSYVHMEETDTDIVGDVYVFDGDEPASVMTGLRFQKMKKVTLQRILMSAAPAGTKKKTQTARFDAPIASESFEKPSARQNNASAVSSAAPSDSASSTGASESSSMTSVEESNEPSIVDHFLKAVAAEVGCDVGDMEPDTEFADFGVDSLMAITVIASIRNETGTELPGSFFLDNQTVGKAIEALGSSRGTQASSRPTSPKVESSEGAEEEPQSQEAPVAEETPATSKETPVNNSEPSSPPPTAETSRSAPSKTPPPDTSTARPAKAILLHGSKTSSEEPLFLLADGSGSASAYVQLPSPAGSRPVYGIESPFARDLAAFGEITVQDLIESYVTAIRSTQAQGPYILGGFSVGAIYAFEAARRLLDAGETVAELMLVGMPALAAAPGDLVSRTLSVEDLEQAGLLSGYGGNKRPSLSANQKKHLATAIQCLLSYEAKPLAGSQPKHTTVVVASKGLGEGAESANSPITPWFHSKWKSSDAMGWDSLVKSLETYKIDTDYFSMLKNPLVKELGQILYGSIQKATN